MQATESPGKGGTWQRTKVPNLLRHKGGRYYARFFLSGKTKFMALGTDVFEVAKIRIAEQRTKIERQRMAGASVSDGTCNMGDLVIVERARIAARADIAEESRKRLLEHVAYIGKTWPGFLELPPQKITKTAVEAWRDKALTAGTGYRPPGAKGESKGTAGKSPGTFNKAVDALRKMLDIAVERGALAHNPIAGRGIKAKLSPRKPHLPDTKILMAICAEIERGGGVAGWGVEGADFCRFLMFTGCRKSEAAAVTWQDVDLERGVLRVRGTKTDAAEREIPLIPAARGLLAKIQARRLKVALVAVNGVPQLDKASAVLAVGEAQKSLDRACLALKAERLTHHDLRDAFATQAIEAGVDIPTVAAWLGHADGGALLMKVYAHHRRAHSVAQALKVDFGGGEPVDGKVAGHA
jgi:integrase